MVRQLTNCRQLSKILIAYCHFYFGCQLPVNCRIDDKVDEQQLWPGEEVEEHQEVDINLFKAVGVHIHNFGNVFKIVHLVMVRVVQKRIN